MDSLIAAAARALRVGDPLAALDRIALRDDPPALALRGIAMAQLGEYDLARKLLRRGVRRFGKNERLARARCAAAESEVALAARDLRAPPENLDAAARALAALGDHDNALHARLVAVRRMVLLGELDEAERALDEEASAGGAPPAHAPAALAALYDLTRAEIALRRVRAREAEAALSRARVAATSAEIPALVAEVAQARRALTVPVATWIHGGRRRAVRLAEIEALLASATLVVDACRRVVRSARDNVPLTGRPVLFALARALAEAHPGDVPRDRLIAQIFEARAPNDSHRMRLRVELGRLRAALRGVARVDATQRGYVLLPSAAEAVAVLAPPVDGAAGEVLALLQGGAPWSSAALGTALGASQRTVQRALRDLASDGAVQSVGHGRARRWLAPAPGEYATTLLLPGALPIR